MGRPLSAVVEGQQLALTSDGLVGFTAVLGGVTPNTQRMLGQGLHSIC